MLIVTTDRLSASTCAADRFRKGPGVKSISNFWFERTRHLVPNHTTTDRDRYVKDRPLRRVGSPIAA
jgi:phosphoribosylaminoimidazole-succinocarboxamide synthase